MAPNTGITLAKIRTGSKFVYDTETTGSADIKAVQAALQCFAYYPGVQSPDGNYGAGTRAAVRGFQNENGLSVNGEFNAATLAKLETFAGTLTTSTLTPTLARVQNGLAFFKLNHSSADISSIKSKLSSAGFPCGTGTTFDGAMVTAVKNFQAKFGLFNDGTVGQATLAVLNDTSSTGWISGTTVKLTPGKLARCGFVKIALRQSVVNDLNAQLTKYGINTAVLVRHFLSQALAEGGGYSFSEFSYKPGELGTATYKPYYGAGWIQLTWVDAYTAFKNHVVTDAKILTPELYATQHVAVKYPAQSACWFWRDYKNISSVITGATSEQAASTAVTKKILGNGASTAAINKRYANYQNVKNILK